MQIVNTKPLNSVPSRNNYFARNINFDIAHSDPSLPFPAVHIFAHCYTLVQRTFDDITLITLTPRLMILLSLPLLLIAAILAFIYRSYSKIEKVRIVKCNTIRLGADVERIL